MRGLEVSLGGLSQDQLVQRQIGDRLRSAERNQLKGVGAGLRGGRRLRADPIGAGRMRNSVGRALAADRKQGPLVLRLEALTAVAALAGC